MMHSLYTKTLYNLRWQLLSWGVGIGFVAFITLVFYNSFNQENASGIESIINALPESLRPLVGSVDDFKSVAGYIGQQVFGPNGYILAVAASVIIAFSVSVNEEDDKRLQSLLTLPVTRSAVFCQKWLALITGIAAITAAVIIGIYLALPIIGHGIDFGRVMQASFDFFLMNGAFATIAFSIAMFIGKKGISIAIASGYAALSFIVTSLAASVDKLQAADTLSVLHYYNSPLTIQHGLKAGHVAVLIGIIVIVATIGWWRFRQRNVGV